MVASLLARFILANIFEIWKPSDRQPSYICDTLFSIYKECTWSPTLLKRWDIKQCEEDCFLTVVILTFSQCHTNVSLWLYFSRFSVCLLGYYNTQILTVLPNNTQLLHSRSNHSTTLYNRYLSDYHSLVKHV